MFKIESQQLTHKVVEPPALPKATLSPVNRKASIIMPLSEPKPSSALMSSCVSSGILLESGPFLLIPALLLATFNRLLKTTNGKQSPVLSKPFASFSKIDNRKLFLYFIY
jgi:hypothetical protein